MSTVDDNLVRAYEEGHAAFRAQPQSACPYEPWSNLHASWKLGFTEASEGKGPHDDSMDCEPDERVGDYGDE